MRRIILTVLLSLSGPVVFAAEVGPLPASEHADTEVSTNVVFALGEGGGRRLVFSLELEATTTNNVEVAIGCDADCDGWLSIDETALAVGYDCGEWFMRPAANDSAMYSDVSDSGVFRRTYEVRSWHIDPSWNLVKATRRGFGGANENVSFSLVESGFGLTIR